MAEIMYNLALVLVALLVLAGVYCIVITIASVGLAGTLVVLALVALVAFIIVKATNPY